MQAGARRVFIGLQPPAERARCASTPRSRSRVAG